MRISINYTASNGTIHLEGRTKETCTDNPTIALQILMDELNTIFPKSYTLEIHRLIINR
jgi:hypothetical protein